jgi:hypothetical protein
MIISIYLLILQCQSQPLGTSKNNLNKKRSAKGGKQQSSKEGKQQSKMSFFKR